MERTRFTELRPQEEDDDDNVGGKIAAILSEMQK